MPTRLSAGPLQVTSLDLTSVNYMLQQVRRELDEIKGLRGTSQFLGDVHVVGSLTLDAPLPWLTSGITGTASTIAAFGATGATALLTRTGSGTVVVLKQTPTLETPVIGDFIYAGHTHQNANGGGTLDHGLALTGLADDDHSAYLLASSATSRAFFAASWIDLTDGGASTLHSHAAGAGSITGSGSAGRVAFWDGAASLSSDADMTFSGDTLSVDKIDGGAGSGGNFLIDSTSHATKGYVKVNSALQLGASGYFVGAESGDGFIWNNSTDANTRMTLNNAGLLTLLASGGGVRIQGGTFQVDSGGYFIGNTDYGYLFDNSAVSLNMFQISNTGNVLIGDNTTANSPGSGTKGLIFADGTALSSMASNTAGLYADDVGGTVNMFAINEAGTVTQLTGGFNGTVTPVTSITVVNGFVTAVA